MKISIPIVGNIKKNELNFLLANMMVKITNQSMHENTPIKPLFFSKNHDCFMINFQLKSSSLSPIFTNLFFWRIVKEAILFFSVDATMEVTLG